MGALSRKTEKDFGDIWDPFSGMYLYSTDSPISVQQHHFLNHSLTLFTDKYMGPEKGGCFLHNPIFSFPCARPSWCSLVWPCPAVALSLQRLTSPKWRRQKSRTSSVVPFPCLHYCFSFSPSPGLFQHGTDHLSQKTGQARPSTAEKEFPLDLVWCPFPNIPGKILAFLFPQPTSSQP